MNKIVKLFVILLLFFLSICFSKQENEIKSKLLKEDKIINEIINKGYNKMINELKLNNKYHNNEELHLNNAIKKQKEKPIGYQCIHDKIAKKKKLKLQEKLNSYNLESKGVKKEFIKTTEPIKPSSSVSAPIRIKFDTSFITDQNDQYACHNVGDVIVLGNVFAFHYFDPSNENTEACLYTCTEKDVQTKDLQLFYQDHVLNTIKEVFEARLLVRDPKDNIIFNHEILDGHCDFGVNVPTEFYTEGINNTDLYVWVTSRPTLSNSTVAYAGACNYDLLSSPNAKNSILNGIVLGRPTGATINFNPIYFKPFIGAENSISFNEFVRIGIHEMTHALGFSSQFFSSFINPESSNNIVIRDGEGAASEIKLSGKTPSGDKWTIKKMAIFSDNVISFARQHFNCSSIKLLELEEFGGEITAGSHWESRTAHEEYMVGFVSPTMPITDLSFNLLKDSGWYDFVPNVGEPFVWGKGLGCDFVQKTCSKETWNYQGYFCTEDGARGCTGTRMGKGVCKIEKYDENIKLKKQFIHLMDQQAVGYDLPADGCPFYQVQDNDVYCFDTSKQSTANSDIFENYCKDCRCFEYQSNPNDSSTINQACWEQRCFDNGLQIKINNEWVDCPSGKIVNSNNVTIVCPLGYTICGSKPQTIKITDKSVTPLDIDGSSAASIIYPTFIYPILLLFIFIFQFF